MVLSMQQYSIAGLTVGVSEGNLSHIPGFTVFSIEQKGMPDVMIRLRETLFDLNVQPMCSFNLEDIKCEFSFAAETYYCKMVQPDGKTLLTTMQLRDVMLNVSTNMNELTPLHLLRFAVWLAFCLFSVFRKTVAIHASAVMYKGKTILFLGESGTGKSTHTGLWLKHLSDTELLNDDSPFVYASEDKAEVFGSPWSGKIDCFRNIKTPIAGVVRLTQAPYNEIKRLSGLSAIGALLPSCPPWFAYDELLSDKICSILSALLKHVSIYSLKCMPDKDAVKLVFSTLKNDGHL